MLKKPALAVVLLFVLLFGLPLPSAFAEEILVAAASDMSFAIKEIVAGFEQKSGHQVKVTLGSSGTFYSQIVNDAPFDVFLSADSAYVQQLQDKGYVEKNTSLVYAVGRIVVWVPKNSPIDVRKLKMDSLLDPAAKRIAIANPASAPYGRAAVAAMEHYGVYSRIKDRVVQGESVSQTAQFVSSGAADIGIIAESLALSENMVNAGTAWEVPTDAYPRMNQTMAVLKHAREAGHITAAQAFLAWMRNDASRAVLKKYGFALP